MGTGSRRFPPPPRELVQADPRDLVGTAFTHCKAGLSAANVMRRMGGLGGRLGWLAAAVVPGVLLIPADAGAAAQIDPVASVTGHQVIQPDADRWSQKAAPSPAPILAAAASMPAPTPEPWDSFARVAPYVESVEPSDGTAPVNAAIVITFSEPMAPGSVERSLVIRPSVEGRQSWRDIFTFRLEPFTLVHGTAYEVRVGGRSARGVPLGGRLVWHFTTRAGPTLVLAPSRSGYVKVPILMYHYIRVNPDSRDQLGFALSVTPGNFAGHMDWLAINGFHPITPADLYAYLTGARGLPSRPVILSFDDGYADFYDTALPILRAHDFTAVAYVVSGFIGRSGYMTASQVLEADRSGIEIGSHTVHHADLAKSSAGNVQIELVASKQALEALLGHPVISFCYPSGRFNGSVVAAVQAAGYQNATTTAYGYVHYLFDRYTWTRLRISGGGSLRDFSMALLTAS